jgi:predicted RND superfamily exporter protein
MVYDGSEQQARDYLYERSLILYYDEDFRQFFTAYLRAGHDLPRNDRDFRRVIVDYFESTMPQMPQEELKSLIDYYVQLGKIPKERKWLVVLTYLLVVGLLVAVVGGAVLALQEDQTVQENAGVLRTAIIVAVVVVLYVWVNTQFRRVLLFVRVVLLTVALTAGVWLLVENGVI